MTQAAWVGFAIALCYQAHLICYYRDTLRLPTIQRHRYHRIKAQLPLAVFHSFTLALAGLSSAIFTYPLISTASLRNGNIPFNLDTLVATWLVVTSWIIGTVCIEAVFTERLDPGDYPEGDRLIIMNKCLKGEHGYVMKLLALNDLSTFSSYENAWRRREVFSDDTGGAWRLVSRPCMQILDSVLLCADAVPLRAQETTGNVIVDKKWNEKVKSTKAGSLDFRMVEAIGRACTDYEQVRFAIRSLCGLLLASLKEDQFGILQLDGAPNLGDVMLALLGAVLVTRRLIKFDSLNKKVVAASIGRGGRLSGDFAFVIVPPSALLHSLQDELMLGMNRIVDSFGDDLIQAVSRTATAVPKYGSMNDSLNLLKELYANSKTLFQTT